jgi:hypothetical protein
MSCSDTVEPPEPPPEPRTCHLPKDDRRIVDLEAYPWDAWFGLRADGTIVRWSSFGFTEFDAAAAGDEPCITSLDADGALGGTSYQRSATMIDYVIRGYDDLAFPHTFDLTGSREAVAVLGTSDFTILDDQSTAWIFWQDRAPDGTTGHQRLEAVSLPGPVVQMAGDDGTCFLLEDGQVYCVDNIDYPESKYGLGDAPPPDHIFKIPVEEVVYLAVGVFHLCVITGAGDTLCAGSGGVGELGVPNEELPPSLKRSTFEPVPDIPELDRIWLRSGSTCGVSSEGELWCWGLEVERPTPNEDVMPPTLVGVFPGLLDVALSDTSTCVLRADHRVVCRGTLPDYLACGEEDGWYVMGIDGCNPPNPPGGDR